MLEDISAHVGDEPCCSWIGPNGAGHFVKMIHNGIEYSDMQVIGEAYELLKSAGHSTDKIADIFAERNEGELSSYLVEITAEVLRQKDPKTGKPLVDVIKNRAGMKGTRTLDARLSRSLHARESQHPCSLARWPTTTCHARPG